jgi:hypothetical protein
MIVAPETSIGCNTSCQPILVGAEAANEVQAMHAFKLDQQGMELRSMSFIYLSWGIWKQTYIYR